MELFFATSNRHKFEEASKVLVRAGLELAHFPFEYREIRSDSLEDIAMDAVEEAYRRCQKPVFVEDTGLFIKQLNGFPGTYSAWVLKKLGTNGILKLMENAKDRSAYFEACIAYHDGAGIRTFLGKCDGSISQSACGKAGFGFDPIFIPLGHSQTFAESIELKNSLSHRYKSLLEFSKNIKLR